MENKFRYNRGHWKFIEKTGPDTVNAYEWEDRTRFKGRMYKSYVTDFLFDRVAEFITRQVDNKKHFALMLSLGDPHHPNKVRPVSVRDSFSHFVIIGTLVLHVG